VLHIWAVPSGPQRESRTVCGRCGDFPACGCELRATSCGPHFAVCALRFARERKRARLAPAEQEARLGLGLGRAACDALLIGPEAHVWPNFQARAAVGRAPSSLPRGSERRPLCTARPAAPFEFLSRTRNGRPRLIDSSAALRRPFRRRCGPMGSERGPACVWRGGFSLGLPEGAKRGARMQIATQKAQSRMEGAKCTRNQSRILPIFANFCQFLPILANLCRFSGPKGKR